MKAGLRKRADIAGMIVMKMRDDDVANRGGIDTKGAKTVDRVG